MSYFMQEEPQETNESKIQRRRQLGVDTQAILAKGASHWKDLLSRQSGQTSDSSS